MKELEIEKMESIEGGDTFMYFGMCSSLLNIIFLCDACDQEFAIQAFFDNGCHLAV
jgi:hypothetical protein